MCIILENNILYDVPFLFMFVCPFVYHVLTHPPEGAMFVRPSRFLRFRYGMRGREIEKTYLGRRPRIYVILLWHEKSQLDDTSKDDFQGGF